MKVWKRGVLALVLLVAACDAAVVEPGGLCQTDSACPASQICRDGQCAATCLSGTVCQTALVPLVGGLSIIEVLALDSQAPVLNAEALFLGPDQEGLDESHALAGTDCVLLPPPEEQTTCGLSAGTITIDGAILTSGDGAADQAAAEAVLEPVDGAGGKEYQQAVGAEARLAPTGTLTARAVGDQVPPFEGSVAVPPPLEDVVVAARMQNGTSRLVVSWAPGSASQLVLRLTGAPAADIDARTSALITTIDPVATDERARTVLCPARDEAGSIVVPASVLSAFTPGPIDVSLVRSTLGYVTLPDGDVLVRAAREVRTGAIIP